MKITKDPFLDSWELAESDQAQPKAQGPELVPCDRKRILIVDDEETVRRITWHVLRNDLGSGYDCDFAENGQEAVKQFTQYHQKLIFLDLSMPVLDGGQAAEQIVDICEESHWETPCIIFRTGYDPGHNIRNIVACDPSHCLLRKPVRNRTLVMAARRRLGLS